MSKSSVGTRASAGRQSVAVGGVNWRRESGCDSWRWYRFGRMYLEYFSGIEHPEIRAGHAVENSCGSARYDWAFLIHELDFWPMC